MHQILIEEADYARLQKIATPFVDTPATIVGRLLDQHFDQTLLSGSNVAQSPRIYGPSSIPPLTHTKVMSGIFRGRAAQRSTWDAMVALALSQVRDKCGGAVDEIRRISGANVAHGAKTEDGYKPLTELGFSYQGVSAEDAVKIIFRCARFLNCSVSIEFVWRDKDGAFLPGERGVLQYNPG